MVAENRCGTPQPFSTVSRIVFIASINAGTDFCPWLRLRCHIAFSVGHNTAANTKPTETDLSARIRSSVFFKANIIIRLSAASAVFKASKSGWMPSGMPNSFSRFKQAREWPENRIFRISSKRRATGSFFRRPAYSAIGKAVCSSTSKPNLPDKRTARRIRTGSS